VRKGERRGEGWDHALGKLADCMVAGVSNAKKARGREAIGELRELKWRNPRLFGPIADGSLQPEDTVISGVVSDALKGPSGGVRRRLAAALCRTMLLRRVPFGLAHARLAGLGGWPNCE
jgi:hypothetical protein